MKTTIIGIAGGTSSGKTTISKKIYNQSIKYGTVLVIKLDDYYKDLSNLTLEERKQINFDHPESYDIDLLIKHLNSLKNGETIKKPTYDFVNYTRSSLTETITPANVIIVEGIMIFQNKELRDLFDIKIFVDTPSDIRFIRRLKRDIIKRGRDVESVCSQYLNTVRPMHLAFVEPSKAFADLIIPEGGNNLVAINVIVTKILELLKVKE